MTSSNGIKNKRTFWLAIALIVVLLSSNNWVRIYNLRQVYGNISILKMSLDAVNHFRTNYGLAATDLAMQKVDKTNDDKIEFIFDYKYHSPIISVEESSRKIIRLTFEKNQIAGAAIEVLNKK